MGLDFAGIGYVNTFCLLESTNESVGLFLMMEKILYV